MSKHIIERVVPQVRYSSPLPIKEVLARLDAALNRTKGEGDTITRIVMTAEPKGDKSAVDEELKRVTGREFGFFSELPHSSWVRKYIQREDLPETRVYTIGNPLIALTVLPHDMAAGLYVPLRVAVTADNAGTLVVYDLPSALIEAGGSRAATEAAHELDRKLEEFVKEVMGLEDS